MQLAKGSGWTFSETVEMILRDWLEQDRLELEQLEGYGSYKVNPYVVDVVPLE